MQFIVTLFMLLLTLVCPSATYSTDGGEKGGILIVSYSTTEPCDRLDRVRFLLSSNDNREDMYPRGDAYVESSDGLSRIVVVENITAGDYKIKFLVPNADNFFADIPEATVTIPEGEVVRFNQTFLPHVLSDEDPEVADSQVIVRPSGTIIINQIYAQINVTTNIPNARWTLLYRNRPVYRGTGSIANYQVPEGDDYNVVPDEIEGYTVKTTAPFSFRLFPGETRTVGIHYERTFGTISLNTPFPDNESLTLVLTGRDTPPIEIPLRSSGGNLSWQSKPLPTGTYDLSFILPPQFAKVPSQKVTIRQGERLKLSPTLMSNTILHINANIPEAVFVLRTINGTKEWKGKGSSYYFRDIPPGMYLLSFASANPEFYIAPKEMRLNLTDMEVRNLNVNYTGGGKLIIGTNVNQATAVIDEIGGRGKSYREQIPGQSKAFTLPEGRYKVSLTPPPGSPGQTTPSPIEVVVKPFQSEQIFLPLRAGAPIKSTSASLTITTNQASSGYSVAKINGEESEPVGHFAGKSTTIQLPEGGTYTITFDPIANNEAPADATLEIKAGEAATFNGVYKSATAMVDIPAGEMILGDPFNDSNGNTRPAVTVTTKAFSIGTYEVTNADFASWLNKAVKNGTAVYVQEADKRGTVLDQNGNVLFKTFEADPYSQISVQKQSLPGISFYPSAGKDSYPVINVSWFGATQYCQENNCRLPTEAEWEKAAGMAPQQEGMPLKKYRFGFGRDEIDPTWANYKESDKPIQKFQVLTTPVGFYNGVNRLPLTLSKAHSETTHDAASPYGAYDMSGNVWEWVSDWYDNPGTKKVAKGGCYDSLADGIRVSERIGLLPDHTDAFTGFRIAIDQ